MKKISLPEMKELELEMLVDFDDVCRTHDLRYSLVYGTLLGAVRHQGFIPWDDDIDVVMPRDDYECLLKLQEEFQSDHELCEHRRSEGYIHPIAKLVHTKTSLKEQLNIEEVKPLGVYIDIFPADKVPSEKKAFDEFHKRCFKNARNLAFSVLRFTDSGNPIKNLLKKPVLKYYHRKGAKTYLNKYDQLIEESKHFHTQIYKIIAFPEPFDNEMSEQDFNNLIELPFENHKFYAFANYEQFLTASYGNYRKLPPKEEQVSNHDTLVYWK